MGPIMKRFSAKSTMAIAEEGGDSGNPHTSPCPFCGNVGHVLAKNFTLHFWTLRWTEASENLRLYLHSKQKVSRTKHPGGNFSPVSGLTVQTAGHNRFKLVKMNTRKSSVVFFVQKMGFDG